MTHATLTYAEPRDLRESRSGIEHHPSNFQGLLITQTELVERLQTSLNVERVLALFSEAIQASVPHDGYSYHHSGIGCHASGGRISRHRCNYRLQLETHDLGELELLRGRRFREQELNQLEILLGGLLHPLKNAIQYREALDIAQTDPLTGLLNRTAMYRMLQRELAAFQRYGRTVGLLVVELDGLATANALPNDRATDPILRTVASCLSGAVRQSDIVLRSGATQFSILLHLDDTADAQTVAGRLHKVLEHCIDADQVPLASEPTAHIAITIPKRDDTPQRLLEQAAKAAVAVRQNERQRITLVEPAQQADPLQQQAG